MKTKQIILSISFFALINLLIGCSTLKKPFYYHVEDSSGKQARLLGTMHTGVTIQELPDQIKNDFMNSNPVTFEIDITSLANDKLLTPIDTLVVHEDLKKSPVFQYIDRALEAKNNSPEEYKKMESETPELDRMVEAYAEMMEKLKIARQYILTNSYQPAVFQQGTLKEKLPSTYWKYIEEKLELFYRGTFIRVQDLHIETVVFLINSVRMTEVEVSQHKANRLNPTHSLDLNLLRLAKTKNKTILELDPKTIMSRQCFAESYLLTLKESLSKNIDQQLETFDQLDKAYRSGEIQQINNQIKDLPPELLQCMYIERNLAWLPLIEKQMSDAHKNGSRAFFSFGAGHLGGDKGIIDLLQKKGYRVYQIEVP